MSLNQDFLQNDFERVFQDERLKTDVIYQGQSFWIAYDTPKSPSKIANFK